MVLCCGALWLRRFVAVHSCEARALPRAPQNGLPFTIEDLKSPLELIAVELSPEGLKAYGRTKRAVFVNSSVDVGASNSRLTYHNLAFDGELDNGSFASSTD